MLIDQQPVRMEATGPPLVPWLSSWPPMELDDLDALGVCVCVCVRACVCSLCVQAECGVSMCVFILNEEGE